MAFPVCRTVTALVRMGLSPSHQWDKCRQQKAEVRRQQKAGGRVTRCEHPREWGWGQAGSACTARSEGRWPCSPARQRGAASDAWPQAWHHTGLLGLEQGSWGHRHEKR